MSRKLNLNQMKKQGKGFLIWGGFLAFFAFYPFLLSPIKPYEAVTLGDAIGARAIVSAPLGMKLIAIAAGILSIVICYFFYKIAQGRIKRIWYAKYPGYFLFGVGTGFIIQGTGEMARTAFLQSRGDYNSPGSFLPLIFSVIFISLGYILIFRNKQPVSEVQEQRMNETVNESN